MNTDKIEMVSIVRLTEAFLPSEVLKPIIIQNDKTPSWDGEIFIYKSPGFLKKNIEGRIPIQVKGKFVKEFSGETYSYPLDISDLNNYSNDGGVIFIVVQVINIRESKIYYGSLLPVDISKLLKSRRKNKKSISSKLKHLDITNISVLEDVCSSFLHHREKQYSTISYATIDDIDNYSIITTSEIITRGIPIHEYMLNNEIYLYGKTNENSVPIPLDKILIDTISHPMQLNIQVDSIVYFNHYIATQTKTEAWLTIGRNIKFNLVTGTFKCKNNGDLAERLNDFNFLNHLLKENKFSIGKNEIGSISVSQKDSDSIKNYWKYLNDIQEVLLYFNITSPLDMDSFTNEDYRSLYNLILVIVYQEEVINRKENEILFIKIGNIHISTITVYKDGKLILQNLFGGDIERFEKCVVFESEQSPKIMSSIYVILKKDYLLKSDNLNLIKVEKSIKNIALTNEYSNLVNQFILELIKVYDANLKKEFLIVAQNLTQLLIDFDPVSLIYQINDLQINKRLRTLKPEEKEKIIKMKDLTSDISVICGLNILLESKMEYEYYFQKLLDKDQEAFLTYPIVKLLECR